MRSFDGFKFICLDNFPARKPAYLTVNNDDENDASVNGSDDQSDPHSCLVYSFGLGKDWTFEREMIRMGRNISKNVEKCKINVFIGCLVHGFDHTIDLTEEKNEIDGKFFAWNMGAGTETNKTHTTLADILKRNGHTERPITYLKVRYSEF